MLKHLLINVKVSQNIKEHLINPENQHKYKISITFHMRTNILCSTAESSIVKIIHYYGRESVIFAFTSGQNNCLNNAGYYKTAFPFFFKLWKSLITIHNISMYICTNLCLSISQLVLHNNLYFLPPWFCVLIYLLAVSVFECPSSLM